MPIQYFSLGGDESTQRFFSVAKMPFSIPPVSVVLPHRIRRKFRSTRSRIRSRQTPTSSIASLNFSLNPSDTIRSLRTHQWSYYDAQYIFLALLGIFSLCMIQHPGPLFKTLIAAALMFSLLIPMTRQFFLPFLPIAAWLVFLDACSFISGEYRPPISVRVLPALENILFGANLSNILSAHKNTALNILAWLPYGITHFGAPFVCTALMFLFGPPGTAPVFAKAFGYMNICGVAIQLFFPCAPPWYENMYGLAPANYSIRGSPAGLAAIDELFGISLYTSTFEASPVVFGAFPSLHSGCSTIEALFMAHTFPKLRPLFIFYVGWLWWATMYLSHHYAIDLVAGSLISIFVYYMYRRQLPRLQEGKMFRWDYDYVEYGDPADAEDDWHRDLDDIDEFRPSGPFRGDSDEWTIGSSSSFSSSSRDPSTGNRSPISDDYDGGLESLSPIGASSDSEFSKA